MKRVFLIHGWEGNPDNCWFPWLKRRLKEEGFEVFVPAMPNPDEPRINSWVEHLQKEVNDIDQETCLIGHSIGCQAILRYLETLPKNKKVGGSIFIAGWFNLNMKVLEEEGKAAVNIAKPWLESPIDFKKILEHVNKIVAIFSDDDYYVPLEDSKIFKEKLNAQIIIEHKKGHFDGITELPIALKELLEMSK